MNLVKTTTGLHAAGKGINVAKVLKDRELMSPLAASLGKDNQMVFSNFVQRLGIANRFQGCTGAHRINVKLTKKTVQ